MMAEKLVAQAAALVPQAEWAKLRRWAKKKRRQAQFTQQGGHYT